MSKSDLHESWLNAVAFLNSLAEDPVYGRFGRVFIATADLLSRLAQELAEAKADLAKAKATVAGMVGWLEKNQVDVFRRGIYEAADAARQAKKGESE